MIILFLYSLIPSWRWKFWMELQYAQVEAVFVDLPLMAWGAYMIVRSAGG